MIYLQYKIDVKYTFLKHAWISFECELHPVYNARFGDNCTIPAMSLYFKGTDAYTQP